MGKFDKEIVRLRRKPMKNGGASLYLDFYLDGVRRYEFLRLYLKNELTAADKQENKRTLQLAQAIKGKRLVELQNNQYGFINARENANADFLSYIRIHAHKYNAKSGNMIQCTLKKLEEYARRSTIPFKMIDKDFCVGFVDFLRKYVHHGFLGKQYKEGKRFSDRTITNYYSVLAAYLKRAYSDGLIPENPILKMQTEDKPRRGIAERDYLTEDEVRKLYATPVYSQTDSENAEVVKKMFLFGCTTGLRYSDICTLRWDDLTEKNGLVILKKRQVKTQNVVEFPLSTAAKKLLPARPKEGSELVFVNLHKSSVIRWLNKWTADAAIGHKVTFHMSRHTFATIMLTKGADLYVVSKLLGHRSISSTQIYAKVVDERKKQAIDLMPDF